MLPPFDKAGNLPPGIHWVSWSEFSQRFGTSLHRKKLLVGLREVLLVLLGAGCGGEMFVAGGPADLAGRTFLQFFQEDREGNPKGIVAFDLQRMSL